MPTPRPMSTSFGASEDMSDSGTPHRGVASHRFRKSSVRTPRTPPVSLPPYPAPCPPGVRPRRGGSTCNASFGAIVAVLGEPAFENDLCRHGIGAAAARAALDEASPRFAGGEPFVGEVDRQPRSHAQTVREPARSGGNPLVGAVHVERQSDHERVGFPAFDEPVDGVPVRPRPPDRNRLERRGGAGHRLPDRGPDSFLAEVECDQRLRLVHLARSYRIRPPGACRPDAARPGRPPSARAAAVFVAW